MKTNPNQTLQDLAHSDARAALAAGTPVYLPVNPVEYHGPHLSLHNDAIISAGLTRDLHLALAATGIEGPLLQAADLEIGVDTVPGPGSRNVSYPVASRLVRDACIALADLGARRVVLMTFHGSPMHSLSFQSGMRALRKRGVEVVSPFSALFSQIVHGGSAADWERIRIAADKEGGEVRQVVDDWGSHDFHAGLLETSLTLHYNPDTVSPQLHEVPPCPRISPAKGVLAAARGARALGQSKLATELDFAAHGLGWNGLRPFFGYTSQPHLASSALGEVLAEMFVGVLVSAVRGVFERGAPSPPPSMPWLVPLTLGGRLPAIGRNPVTAPTL